MRNIATLTLAALGMSAGLSACMVVPEEPDVTMTDPVVVAPTIPDCYEVAQLQRVEIPAETKTVYGVSVIENPPYAPIEQRTEQKIIIRPAQVSYVRVDAATGNQVQVTNLCDSSIEIGPVGPGAGELSGVPIDG